MRVMIFGASGMVGQGVLRECLRDNTVHDVLCIGRSKLAQQHPKLRQLLLENLFDLRMLASDIDDFDACFFCLGVSSFRMKEDAYRHVIQALTLSIAKSLLHRNPAMVFAYVSGAGTDANSKTMRARAKGETENSLLAMPFQATYIFRPGLIVPMHGVWSRTPIHRAIYTTLRPLLWLLRRSPRLATTTEAMGRAMLQVASTLPAGHILDNRAINYLGTIRT